jgi:hypothetical protein
MAGHGSKLGSKQEAAIHALLTQRNTEEAARAAGISKRTLIRWQKIPEFQAAHLEARRASISQGDARLQHGYGAAVSTLFKTMTDSNSPASVRLRAAKIVMDRGKQSIETEDLGARVTALEQIAEQRP